MLSGAACDASHDAFSQPPHAAAAGPWAAAAGVGQPVKALVHIYFAELREMGQDSALQDKWIEEYRARWAAQRAAASVSLSLIHI